MQLLLWSVVSGSNFDKLSYDVQADAMHLLTPRQIFELKGGVMGVVKTVSNHLPSGIMNGNNDIVRLFEVGTGSYEMFERVAVLREPSKIKRSDFKNDQWYKQQDQYYVRYFPVSYQKVRIQVYVPGSGFDSTGKINGDYLVFDPTGLQAIPANSNSQRLGVGGPLLDIVKVIIKTSQKTTIPRRVPEPKREPEPKTDPKTGARI